MDILRTIALLALIITTAPSAAHAGGSRVEDYCRAAGWKLAHGLMSVPYSVVDVLTTPVGMAIAWDKDGRVLQGLGMGIPFGLINANLRLDQAAVNILTFPFVNRGNPRPFKFEPFLTGWRPILDGTASSAAPPDYSRRVRSDRPSGD